MKILGKDIRFIKPEMPSDIIWENTGLSPNQKLYRKIVVLIGLLIVMFISYRAQIKLKTIKYDFKQFEKFDCGIYTDSLRPDEFIGWDTSSSRYRIPNFTPAIYQ